MGNGRKAARRLKNKQKLKMEAESSAPTVPRRPQRTKLAAASKPPTKPPTKLPAKPSTKPPVKPPVKPCKQPVQVVLNEEGEMVPVPSQDGVEMPTNEEALAQVLLEMRQRAVTHNAGDRVADFRGTGAEEEEAASNDMEVDDEEGTLLLQCLSRKSSRITQYR